MLIKMRSIQKFAACVLALVIAISRVEIIFTREIPITFSLIVSFGRFGYNSSPSIPAINLALKHIHSSGVLGEYKLNYSSVKDSECSRGKSLDAFFDDILLQPDSVKIALIGCGCSVATEPVAEISHKWNISQISFASAVSTLSDRTRFKNLFRTYPNVENFAPALLSVLNHYNWSQIVFLTQNENLFNKLHADFQALLKNLKTNTTSICCFSNTNVTVVNKRFTTGEGPITTTVDVFEDDGDYRVFYINTYSGTARHIICEAARRNLTYPRYVWITFGWYPHGWWTKEVTKNDVSCSDWQLEDFIEKARMLQVQQYPTPNDFDGSTIFGITPRQFEELYENESIQSRYTPTLVRGVAYDAVWTLALGLNRTQEMFLSNYNVSKIGCDGLDGGLVPLEQFNYSNGVMGCVMRWSLEQTNFSGMSGRVRFDENGTFFQDKIRLLQYRRHSNGIEQLRFGFVNRTANSVLTYEENETCATVFPGKKDCSYMKLQQQCPTSQKTSSLSNQDPYDGVPPDGTPQEVIHTFQLGLVVVFYFLAAVGFIFCVACLMFNFVFRNRSVVRMSSPKLNYLIIAGSLLMYFSVYVQLLYSTNKTANHIRCILHTWMYVLGYLLVFGTILAKMWRVYQIFHNPTPNKMAPKDWYLVLIVVLIISISIPLVVGKSVSQMRPPMLLRDNENREGRMALGVRQKNYVWVCYQPGSPAFYCDLLIFLYLGVLQIVGLILAFQTRKVKIPILNDSKFVAALVYISSVVFVALALVTFLLRDYINISNGTFSGGIMLLATIFLILMFVPKMLNLYSDPEGKRIFEKSNPTTAHHPTISTGPATQSGPDREKTIGDAQEALKERDRRISELERELILVKNGRPNTQE